jgi:hypothetical protein
MRHDDSQTVLMAAMCAHVPNKGEQMERYYGYYSNVARSKRKKAAMDDAIGAMLNTQSSDKDRRRHWARKQILISYI